MYHILTQPACSWCCAPCDAAHAEEHPPCHPRRTKVGGLRPLATVHHRTTEHQEAAPTRNGLPRAPDPSMIVTFDVGAMRRRDANRHSPPLELEHNAQAAIDHPLQRCRWADAAHAPSYQEASRSTSRAGPWGWVANRRENGRLAEAGVGWCVRLVHLRVYNLTGVWMRHLGRV